LVKIIVPSSVEVLGEKCFLYCESLSLVIFESGSRLSRIEKLAFSETGLVEIIIPSSVEVLGESCFHKCGSLSSVKFQSGSRLREVGRDAFSGVPIHPTLPSRNAAFTE
jgi:hypothetical protein